MARVVTRPAARPASHPATHPAPRPVTRLVELSPARLPAAAGSAPAAAALRRELRGPVVLGAALVFGLLGSVAVWAATAPLAGAVVAPGVVSPEGNRFTIQHLEGGIVRRIKVKEGDAVTAGSELVILEDIAARAELTALRSQLFTHLATEAGLEAERAGRERPEPRTSAFAPPNDPELVTVLRQKGEELRASAANLGLRKAILGQRVAQLQRQIEGFRRQQEAVRIQTELLDREIAVVDMMVRKGYERQPRLLALQRTHAERMGADGELEANVARAEEAISEAKLQLLNLETERRERIEAGLAEVRTRIRIVEEQLRGSADRLVRTVVRAPADGIVLDLRTRTLGAVVRPGEPILDLVPTGVPLIIDSRVAPTDIDDVRAGQTAETIFPSYPQRSMMRVPGRVRQISADAMTDEATHTRYYTAKVEIDRARLAALDPDIVLTPGMPADVFIATGERTMLDYILQPLRQVLARSLRER